MVDNASEEVLLVLGKGDWAVHVTRYEQYADMTRRDIHRPDRRDEEVRLGNHGGNDVAGEETTYEFHIVRRCNKEYRLRRRRLVVRSGLAEELAPGLGGS